MLADDKVYRGLVLCEIFPVLFLQPEGVAGEAKAIETLL